MVALLIPRAFLSDVCIRLFVPVEDRYSGQQYIHIVDKKEDGSVEKKRLYGVMYVPLTDPPVGE